MVHIKKKKLKKKKEQWEGIGLREGGRGGGKILTKPTKVFY